MLGVAGLAFIGAPYYITFLAAVLLTITTLYEYAHLQPRFQRLGSAKLAASGIAIAAGTSLGFSLLCFAVGRFFAWLIGL
jgi:hypothetical protein